jgi:alkanesulfonate monooxygenase SsuD/methylene tetrahydromethanopterin reductase-like flavin-dependent oxidoreductase (luciferase family)
MGGFNDKALERIARFGDGYFGNMEVVEPYLDKLRLRGKDPRQARIRIQGLFVVVAKDPDKALDELAPYFHHVNNTYGQWLNEDRASSGFGNDAVLQPMTLEAFKSSGILRILTPPQAVDLFNDMRSKAPVEHFMMMLPPGLEPWKFAPYAEVFAQEVLPHFA